jgi:hypothetical protein
VSPPMPPPTIVTFIGDTSVLCMSMFQMAFRGATRDFIAVLGGQLYGRPSHACDRPRR